MPLSDARPTATRSSEPRFPKGVPNKVLTDPTLAKFRDTLERLHRNARGIHAKHDAPAAPADDCLEWLIDAALVDLTDLCTPQERRRLTVNRYL
ncbi:hypothetical protein [Rhodococcus sp. LW-XY12]|uniref:hypothetical protein n=1 Tax=Rhodococcus sp. LW-XY12 TaxID=2856851 RepID=UPI001C598F2F|nr:hypothetical protein [Rhodococcus sp. LW-XY12]QXU52164.1 hypothetical protein KXC42_14785 [Rhodococcus sp. LW-XY12]